MPLRFYLEAEQGHGTGSGSGPLVPRYLIGDVVVQTRFETVLDLQTAKTAQAKEIATLKKRVKKLERKRRSIPTGLRRLRKGRKIAEIDQDENVNLIDETQEQLNNEEMFGVNDLHDKGKGIMIEPERPLKIKDQIAADEELARQLEAEMQAEIEEERTRRKKEEEANLALIKYYWTLPVDKGEDEELQLRSSKNRNMKGCCGELKMIFEPDS
ncbi:hypothetical protein Tco_0259661 [Tanacetum coccineum]